MDYQLVVVRGRSDSHTVKLAEGVTVVGRQEGNQLRINSSQVSRKHCQLFENQGVLVVKDLGSANGTLVNGKKIEDQRVLEPGDILTIGSVKFRVEKIGAPTKKPQPAAPGKMTETAIAAAVAADEAVDDDEEVYDAVEVIDDDAPTQHIQTVDVADEPKPKTPPKGASHLKPPAPPKAKPKPKQEEEPEEMGEDAVADFLMDIQVDEDE